MFFFQYKLLFNCVVWGLLFFRGTDLRGNWFRYKISLCDGRNVPLLPVDWKTISKRMMSANPVYGTNIKAPELAVKGTPQKELRIP